jgi:hypothetical protein
MARKATKKKTKVSIAKQSNIKKIDIPEPIWLKPGEIIEFNVADPVRLSPDRVIRARAAGLTRLRPGELLRFGSLEVKKLENAPYAYKLPTEPIPKEQLVQFMQLEAVQPEIAQPELPAQPEAEDQPMEPPLDPMFQTDEDVQSVWYELPSQLFQSDASLLFEELFQDTQESEQTFLPVLEDDFIDEFIREHGVNPFEGTCPVDIPMDSDLDCDPEPIRASFSDDEDGDFTLADVITVTEVPNGNPTLAAAEPLSSLRLPSFSTLRTSSTGISNPGPTSALELIVRFLD